MDHLDTCTVHKRSVEGMSLFEEAVCGGMPIALVAEHGVAEGRKASADLLRSKVAGRDAEE